MRLVLISACLLLAACGKAKVEVVPKEFAYTYETYPSIVFIDKETGCEYFLFRYGIKTPRYDATGERVLGCKDPGL